MNGRPAPVPWQSVALTLAALALAACASDPPRARRAPNHFPLYSFASGPPPAKSVACEQGRQALLAADKAGEHERVLELAHELEEANCWEQLLTPADQRQWKRWLITARGRAYFSLERPAEALQALDSLFLDAPEEDEGWAFAYELRAVARMRHMEGRPYSDCIPAYRSALADLERAMALGATFSNTPYNRARVLMALGRLEESAAALRDESEHGRAPADESGDPVQEEVRALLSMLEHAEESRDYARALMGQDRAQALAHLGGHLQRLPGDIDARTLQAGLLAEQALQLEGESRSSAFAAVLEHCEVLRSLDPESERFLFVRAFALDQLGRAAEAQQAYGVYLERIEPEGDPGNHEFARARHAQLVQANPPDTLEALRQRAERGDGAACFALFRELASEPAPTDFSSFDLSNDRRPEYEQALAAWEQRMAEAQDWLRRATELGHGQAWVARMGEAEDAGDARAALRWGYLALAAMEQPAGRTQELWDRVMEQHASLAPVERQAARREALAWVDTHGLGAELAHRLARGWAAGEGRNALEAYLWASAAAARGHAAAGALRDELWLQLDAPQRVRAGELVPGLGVAPEAPHPR